jgi:hypothetical protein
MREVIYSNGGRAAALAATKAGLPAMAGIDPMLQEALGSDYGPHNMGTHTAGGIVGELMQSLATKTSGKNRSPTIASLRQLQFGSKPTKWLGRAYLNTGG